MGREPREETREAEGRKKRVPLGRRRMKLDASRLIPRGKVGRWINDDPGRLEAAQEAGYTFVQDPNAKIGEGAENERDRLSMNVRRRVGTSKDNTAKIAYLMVIDRELYEEDQQAKEADRKQVEDTMRRGLGGAEKFGADGRYDADGGVRIQHGHKQ